jgi:hypothetical protein
MLDPGISYHYHTGFFRDVHDFAQLKPQRSGTLANFSIDSRDREQYFAFDFMGYINILTEGYYTFYLKSNDGARMYLDEQLLINNDGLHPAAEESQTAALTKGLHLILIRYFQEGGTHHFEVSWKGPGFDKQSIPSSVLFHKKD